MRPLRWLGRISCSFYPIHMVALYAVLWMLRAWNLSQINRMLLTLAGTLSITLVASQFSYEWIERPFIELGRRVRPREFLVESGVAT